MAFFGGFLIILCVSFVLGFRHVGLTDDKEKCMSTCVTDSSSSTKGLCWVEWGKHTDCTSTTEVAAQYLTTGSKNIEKRFCTTLCMKYKRLVHTNYYWCLTGDNGEWDYCSPSKSMSVYENPCFTNCTISDGDLFYTCRVTDNRILADTFEKCSPAPYHPPTAFVRYQSLNDRILLKSKQTNAKTQCFKILEISSASRIMKRSLDDRSCFDVRELVSGYENFLPVQRLAEPGRAVIDYTSILTDDNVEVLLTMRATLRRATTPASTAGRTHPNGTTNRMRELNQLGEDDIGHVLALSLGGPENALINLLPQHRIVNRNYGAAQDITSFSYWRQIEIDLQKLLRNGTVDYIDWVFVSMYEGSLNALENRRAVAFALNYRIHHNNVVIYESGDCFFDNHEAGGGDPI